MSLKIWPYVSLKPKHVEELVVFKRNCKQIAENIHKLSKMEKTTSSQKCIFTLPALGKNI